MQLPYLQLKFKKKHPDSLFFGTHCIHLNIFFVKSLMLLQGVWKSHTRDVK